MLSYLSALAVACRCRGRWQGSCSEWCGRWWVSSLWQCSPPPWPLSSTPRSPRRSASGANALASSTGASSDTSSSSRVARRLVCITWVCNFLLGIHKLNELWLWIFIEFPTFDDLQSLVAPPEENSTENSSTDSEMEVSTPAVTGIAIDQFQYLHFKKEFESDHYWVIHQASQKVTVGFLLSGESVDFNAVRT